MYICSVIIYPVEKKFIGTSSILAGDKSRVLPADPLFTTLVTGTAVIFHLEGSARPPICLSFEYNLSNAIISSTPSNVPITSAIASSKSFGRTGI